MSKNLIKFFRLNDGVKYEFIPTAHTHKLEEVKDFTKDLSEYDNSNAQFATLKVFSGTSEPSNDLGKDGDIYFLLEE